MSSETLLKRLGALDAPPETPLGACLTDDALRDLRTPAATDAARETAEAHLATCPVCVDRLLALDAPLPSLGAAARDRILAQTRPARRPWWRAAWVPATVAAAAAAALWVAIPRGEAPVGPWALSVEGGIATARGVDPAPASRRFDRHSAVVLTLLPEGGPGGAAVQTAAYVGPAGGATLSLVPQAQTRADPTTGLVELRVDAEAAFLAGPGAYQIGALVAPAGAALPSHLPADASDLPPGARLLTAGVQYTP